MSKQNGLPAYFSGQALLPIGQHWQIGVSSEIKNFKNVSLKAIFDNIACLVTLAFLIRENVVSLQWASLFSRAPD